MIPQFENRKNKHNCWKCNNVRECTVLGQDSADTSTTDKSTPSTDKPTPPTDKSVPRTVRQFHPKDLVPAKSVTQGKCEG